VGASTPPSPQSLQPQYPDSTACDSSADYNPHKKLTHVSSLSAPDVNKVTTPSPKNTNRRFRCSLLSPRSSSSSVSPPESVTGGVVENVSSECGAAAVVAAVPPAPCPESAVSPSPRVSPPSDAVLLQANQVRPPSTDQPKPDDHTCDQPKTDLPTIDQPKPDHAPNPNPHNALCPSPTNSPVVPTSKHAAQTHSAPSVSKTDSELESQSESCSGIMINVDSFSTPETSEATDTDTAPKPKSFRKRLPRISLLAPFRRMFTPRSTPDLTDAVEKPVRRRKKKGRKDWRKSFPGLGKSEATSEVTSEKHWRHSVPVLESGCGSGTEESSQQGTPVVLSHSFDILPCDSSGDVQVLSKPVTKVSKDVTKPQPPTIEIHVETPTQSGSPSPETSEKANSDEDDMENERHLSRPRYLRVWRKSLTEAYATDLGKEAVPEYSLPEAQKHTDRDERYRCASESRDDALLDDDGEIGDDKENVIPRRIEGDHQGLIFVDRMKYRLSEVDEDQYIEYAQKQTEMSDGNCDESDIIEPTKLTTKTDIAGCSSENLNSLEQADDNDSENQSKQETNLPNSKTEQDLDIAEIIDGPKYEDEDISENSEAPVIKPRSGFSKWLSASSKYTYNPARGVYRHDEGEEGVLVEPLPPEPPTLTGAIASKLSLVKDKVVNDVIPAIPALSGIKFEKLLKEKEPKPERDRVLPVDGGPQAPLYYPPSLSNIPIAPSLSSSLDSLHGSEEESDKVPEHLVRPHRPKSLVAKWWNSSKPSKYTYHPTAGVLKHDLASLYAMYDNEKGSRGSFSEWMHTMSCVTMDPESMVSPHSAETVLASPIVVLPTEEPDSTASSSSEQVDSHVPVLILPARNDKTQHDKTAPINQPVVLYPLPSGSIPTPPGTPQSANAPLPPSIKQPIIIYPTKPPEGILQEVKLPTANEHEEQKQKEMEEECRDVLGPEAQPVILYSPPTSEREMKPTSPTASAIAQPLLLATPPQTPLVTVAPVMSNTLPRAVSKKPNTNTSSLPRTMVADSIQPETTVPVASKKPKKKLRRRNTDEVPRPSILFGLECSHPYDSVPNLAYPVSNLKTQLRSQNQLRDLDKTQESTPGPLKSWRMSLPPDNQAAAEVVMRTKPDDYPSFSKDWRMSLPCPPPSDTISLPRWRMWKDSPSPPPSLCLPLSVPPSTSPPPPTTPTNPWSQVSTHTAHLHQSKEQEEHSKAQVGGCNSSTFYSLSVTIRCGCFWIVVKF
jgi:hypothetical protein